MGDTLKGFNNDFFITDIKIIADTFARGYNFSVEKGHNYYVSSIGILVHNECFNIRIPFSSYYKKALGEIQAGKGIARMENGIIKTIKNRNNTKWEREWEGAEEFDVKIPRRRDVDRILRKQTGTDGSGNPINKYGATNNHYGQEGTGPAIIPFTKEN